MSLFAQILGSKASANNKRPSDLLYVIYSTSTLSDQRVDFEKTADMKAWIASNGRGLTKLKAVRKILGDCDGDLSYMFSSCVFLISLDLTDFNTSDAKDMSYMLSGFMCLTSLDLSSFDTSNVENMSSMLSNCSVLTSLDLSSFDTSNVKNMSSMFYNCSVLTSLDLSSFDTSNVEDMSSMLRNCSAFIRLDLSNFNTSNVKNMSSMFRGCSNCVFLYLKSFTTESIENMSSMFEDSVYGIVYWATNSNTVQNVTADTYMGDVGYIYVPNALLSTYKTTQYFKDWTSILKGI